MYQQPVSQPRLQEFRTILQRMGAHPDRALIEKLTSQARQAQAHPQAVMELVQFLLVRSLGSSPEACRVPILFVADSILKNVGGAYVAAMEPHIHRAFCESFSVVGGADPGSMTGLNGQIRLYRMLQTWERNTPPLFPYQTVAIRKFILPWIEAQAASQPQQAATQHPPTTTSAQWAPPQTAAVAAATGQQPVAKRPRTTSTDPSTVAAAFEVEAVVEAAAARSVLTALQDGLTTQPMTLEELWESDPEQAKSVHAHAQASLLKARENTAPLANAPAGASVRGATPGSLPNQARAMLAHLATHAKGTRNTMSSTGGLSDAQGAVAMAGCAAACQEALSKALQAQRTHALAAAAAQGAKQSPMLKYPPPGGAKQAAAEAATAACALFALPHRCALDGLHFASAASLAEHQEVLEARVRERLLSQQHAKSRGWAPPASAWVADGATVAAGVGGAASDMHRSRLGEVSGASEGPTAGGAGGRHSTETREDSVAMVGLTAAPCRLCGEPFETAYDELREQWRYQGAVESTVRADDDVDGNGANEMAILHRACADASAIDGTIKRSLLL